jgi:hypothetical protein
MSVANGRIGKAFSRKLRIGRAGKPVVEELEVRRLMHFAPVPLAPIGAAAQLTPHVGPFAAAGANSIPALNSDPDATAQLFIDFAGYGSISWGGKTTGVTPAYDTDGDPSTFTTGELSNIQQIWQRVSEIYSPFNINVTTVNPGNLTDGITTEVVVGGNGAWYGPAGGVAFVGGFSNSASNIAWVFPGELSNGNTKYTAEAVSHEAGHTFGLQHQSVYSGTKKTNEYYSGTAAKAPIMGDSYGATRALWWVGQSSLGSTIIQNDVSVIASNTNGFGYRTDDHGSTTGTADALDIDGGDVSQSGIIEQLTDTDWFSFTTLAGDISLTVSPAQYAGMLDGKLTLLASDGTTVVASADTSSLGETISTSVAGGTYYLVVGGEGNAGDLGEYTISGTVITSPDYVARPTNLAAVQSGSDVDLTWHDAADNETGYVIERSDNGGSTWNQIGTPDEDAAGYNDMTSAYGASYKYRVMATGSVQNSSYTTTGTVNVVPNAPSGLTATSMSATEIDLAWTDIQGETGYKIERSPNSSAWTLLTTTASDAVSYDSTGLTATTKYYYRVTSVSAAGDSVPTSAVSATTTPPTPTTLTGATTPSSISLSWTNVAGETGYRVEHSTDDSAWSQLAITAANVVTYANSGLSQNTTYYYRVKAIGAGGDSPPTSAVSKTTLLNAPTGVFVYKPTATSVKVSWTDSISETGYRLEELVGKTWTQVGANLAANTTSVTVGGLTAGTAYSFRVFAITPAGTSAASSTSSTPQTGGLMKLAWSNVSGETGYRIDRSLDGSTWKWVGTAAANVLTLTDTELAGNTAYYYRICAFSDGGNGAYSSTANATTLVSSKPTSSLPKDSAPASASTMASIVLVAPGKAKIAWAKVNGATTYSIERSINGKTWATIKVVGSKVLSYLDSGLKARKYYYRIVADNSAGKAIGYPKAFLSI